MPPKKKDIIPKRKKYRRKKYKIKKPKKVKRKKVKRKKSIITKMPWLRKIQIKKKMAWVRKFLQPKKEKLVKVKVKKIPTKKVKEKIPEKEIPKKKIPKIKEPKKISPIRFQKIYEGQISLTHSYRYKIVLNIVGKLIPSGRIIEFKITVFSTTPKINLNDLENLTSFFATAMEVCGNPNQKPEQCE